MNIREECETYLFMYLQNKIIWRTADSYYELIPQYNTIEAFLSNLCNLQYSNIGEAQGVISQLKKIKQLQNESAMEFGQKVQKLCGQLQALIGPSTEVRTRKRTGSKKS
jgi:hypothetical protein